jgi:hypothetical protein
VSQEPVLLLGLPQLQARMLEAERESVLTDHLGERI